MLHEGVIYRHIILTVPAMFRTSFYQNASLLLSELMRCGVQCMDDFYSEVRGKRLRGGGSRSNGTINNDPLEVFVFVGLCERLSQHMGCVCNTP